MAIFTTVTATAAARKSHAARGTRTELKQAIALQDLAYKAALSASLPLSREEKFSREDAVALAALLKSWDTLSNRVRILRGRPLPGSRRPPPEHPAPVRYPLKNRPPTFGAPA
jgi:hypothetical protein